MMTDDGASSSNAMARMFTEDDVFQEESESSLLMLDAVEQHQAQRKDPRKIARKYQLELCDKALNENIIVYLGTGCGKTHISVLVMYELRHLITKPQKDICVFLAPTVALVQQQAKVIEESTDFKVGTFSGDTRQSKYHRDWEKELEEYEVFVMTPQIFLRCLYHCFIRMDSVALLIFDECHHAQLNRSHPYAEIMKIFYKVDAVKVPRIFGMTASPVVGKEASCEANLSKSLNSLEEVLHAKVYSVEDTKEMDTYVSSPSFNIYYYGPIANKASESYKMFCNELTDVKRECFSTLSKNENDPKIIRSTRKMLNGVHSNTVICLENLGLWGALQAANILLSGDHAEGDQIVDAEESSGDDSICNTYLARAVKIFASDLAKVGLAYDLPPPDVLEETFFSKKLLRLVEILSGFREQPEMKCIIFVKRIITARALSYILNNIKGLASWKCDFLLGVHSGAKKISRKAMNAKLEKFRSGELNLLIATKVGEEGLDIQTCCLVIRFDLPETVASFIQSRGRARMPKSKYAFLVDSGNQGELDLIENFRKEENRMNLEISARTSADIVSSVEEAIYKVNSSGASISLRYSVSLLHDYCARLPRDEFFIPMPEFYYFDDGGTVCHIIMPSNAPIHQVVSAPNQSLEAAKRDACLKAIEELHKLGALTDYLLPDHNHANEQEEMALSGDSDSYKDEDSGGELHAMYVPTTLKNSYNDSENLVQLSSYRINLSPVPPDRTYRDFCLFVNNPLPEEAERMKLELHLAHGRSVMTDLVPLGTVAFDKDEIHCAKNYQEMFFKVLLDRSELAEESVCLGRNGFCWSISLTFYLILPIILPKNRDTLMVDWKMVRRSLSSPIFKTSSDKIEESSLNDEELLLDNSHVVNNAKIEERSPKDDELLLANGCIHRRDIIQSLVYVPQKKVFYFVNSIRYAKDGSKWLEDLTSSSDKEISSAMYGVQLKHPNQPLLKLKPLLFLHNLLHNRHPHNSAPRELEEYFIHLPPELCVLKIIGFSKDIGSTVSLLPSIMHRLENLLVAAELKDRMSSSFPEAAELSVKRILEAITTEKCQERFSLERLETLGDSFLKYAVGRHLFLRHKALDEGELTRIRSGLVNNNNLRRLALEKNLQVYIRDQPLDPDLFFAPGRPCLKICNEETQEVIHSLVVNDTENIANGNVIKCSKGHHWLRNKIIADMVEALVGAFLVDCGFKGAVSFLRWIGMSVDFEESDVTSVLLASRNYMPLSSHIDIAALESELNYKFHCKGLLLQAFIHPSYNKHGGGCYQRLEFLGDAVLDFLITSYLYSAYPKLKPGQLTDLRSASVNNKAFADVAVRKSLYKFIICNSSALSRAIKKYVDYGTPASIIASENSSESAADNSSVKGPPMCPKVLGDLIESCTGAILLDTGFNLNSVWRVVLSLLDPLMSLSSLQLSPLRELIELCQSLNWEPPKFSSSKKGRGFIVKAEVIGKDIYRTTSIAYQNKKEAIRIASRELLAKLKAEGYASKSKSLQEVLNASRKMEPKLIGFDETALSTPDLVGSNNVYVQENSVCRLEDESSCGKQDSNVRALCTPSHDASSHVPSSSKLTAKDHGHNRSSRSIGKSQRKTARALLYELCAGQYWKIPLFECCKEEGQDHIKLFTFKVVVEIDDVKPTILECCGEPQKTKKAASERAAAGAIWYLRTMGYF